MSAINKILVPELHKDVCHQLMEMFCFFLGDLDYKASLDCDNGDFSNLATNELLIWLPASRLEILQLSWEMFKLNMHTGLCPVCAFLPSQPHYSVSLRSRSRQRLVTVTGAIQNLLTFPWSLIPPQWVSIFKSLGLFRNCTIWRAWIRIIRKSTTSLS